MSGLRETAGRAIRADALPVPNPKRVLQTEKVAARLQVELAQIAGSGIGTEPWQTVAARIDFDAPGRSRPRDVRRALGEIWTDDGRQDRAAPLVDHGLAATRKSYDRALIIAYLRVFPIDHPAFDRLARSAEQAAGRHDWAWGERGKRWNLWNAEQGRDVIAQAMLARDDPRSVLADAGLDGDLSEGGFVAHALGVACERAGDARGAEAETLGARLLTIFDRLGVGGANAMLVYGLLNPWRKGNPSEAYRKAIGTVLAKRVGDPRVAPARWTAIIREIGQRMPGADAAAMIGVLRRWLTNATVRAFFSIIGRTTERKDQWAAREAFWLAYLDADLVTDAWVAFGRQAERIAGVLARQEAVEFGRVVGGSDPSHSSLLMSIGDMRIAEWSHNGACRFWPAAAAAAPVLFRREYDGRALRTTSGPADFDYIAHQGSWEVKFARKIHRSTGVAHPMYDRGAY